MRGVIAVGVGLLFVVASMSEAGAASPEAEPLPATASSDAEVRELYETGVARFEAGEYNDALIVWKQALVLVSFDADQQATRAGLVANIVAAHRREYERGRNPEHLAEALRVIDLRKKELDQLGMYDEAATVERQRLAAEKEEIVSLQRLARRNDERAEDLPAGTAFHVEPKLAVPADHPDAVVAADPDLGPAYRRGKALSDAGIVVLAVGGGILIPTVLIGAFFDPKDGRKRDVIPVVAPLGGVVVAAAIIGGTLLGVGNKRKAAAREGYRHDIVVAPLSLPRGAGLGVAGRF